MKPLILYPRLRVDLRFSEAPISEPSLGPCSWVALPSGLSKTSQCSGGADESPCGAGIRLLSVSARLKREGGPCPGEWDDGDTAL